MKQHIVVTSYFWLAMLSDPETSWFFNVEDRCSKIARCVTWALGYEDISMFKLMLTNMELCHGI